MCDKINNLNIIGMIPAMMKVLPATSISYTIFGYLNKIFDKK